MTYDKVYISLGAGTQSTAMAVAADRGLIPGQKVDFCVFADTGREPRHVYENLERLQAFISIPIIVSARGDLLDDVIEATKPEGNRFASVPFWVRGEDGREALPMRQCTRDFKISVVKKAVRTELGLQPRQRAAGKFMCEEWIGISTDEATRAKPSREKWVVSRHPLLYDLGWSRQDCIDYLIDVGYGAVQKSACTFCPYRNPVEYARMRDEDPESFEEAVRVDEMIRANGPMRGMRGLQYIWRELRPLREIPSVEELQGDKGNQLDMFENECEGMCGV